MFDPTPIDPLPWRPLQCAATAALFAVTLGIGLQLTLLASRYWATGMPVAAKAISEFGAGLSWAAIVCSGVALGIGASRHRAAIMGWLGLLCAPTAFALAKGVQRGVETMMTGSATTKLNALLLQIGVIKTIEYGLLALLLAWLIEHGKSTPWRHAAAGLGFGLLGGSAVLVLEIRHATAPLPIGKLLGLGINEVLFPVGCAMVIYAVARLAGQVGPRPAS